MGLIIAKFRKKKNTYDILEKLHCDITAIEEFQKDTQQTQKKIIGRFLVIAFLLYFVLAVFLYIYFYKVSRKERLYCACALVALPLVIWLMKKLLSWHFNRKIRNNEKKLIKLKDEKKKLLENVMETETYKVAKKILDRFGNEPPKKSMEITPIKPSMVVPPNSSRFTQNPLSNTGLRQRVTIPSTTSLNPSSRNRLSFGALTPVSSMVQTSQRSPQTMSRAITGPVSMPITPAPMPRTILPKDRSVFDKLVDYLVGDGPANRYGLICKNCNGHNGMALKEEFEYLSFKCCYCFHFNPAPKKRPSCPPLELESSVSPKKAQESSSDTSDSEKNSSSDTESAEEPAASNSPDDAGKMSDFDKLSDLDNEHSTTKTQEISSEPMEVESDDRIEDQSKGKEEISSNISSMDDYDKNKNIFDNTAPESAVEHQKD